MNRRQLLAAALTLLAWRVAPNALASKAFAATSERDGKMSKATQRIIECNGIHINIAEQGDGPLVLLVHGFPESWFSWRHQIDALAAAGFRVVAPDLRGYGKSDAPQGIDQYTILHLVGDMVGILDALGAASAVIVGHDWAPASPGRQLSRAPTASGRSQRSAYRSGRAARRHQPAPCPAPRMRNSISSISRSRAPRRRSSGAIRVRPFATCCSARPAMAWPRPARPPLPAGPRLTSAWCRRAADSCKVPGRRQPAIMAQRKRRRFLRRGIQAQRFSRSAQLLSQHRSQLGDHGSDGGPAGDGAGALPRGRSRLRGFLPRYGPAARKHEGLRSRPAQDPDASRLWPLDSAGATERGQCRACGIHSSLAEPLMTMLTLPFPAAS